MSRSVEFLVFDNYSECPPVTKAAFAFHLCFLALAFAFQVFNKYNSSLAQMFQRVKKSALLLGQHLTLIGGDTSTRRGLQVLGFQIPWTILNVHLACKKPLICATSHSTPTKTAPSQVGTDPEGEEDEIFFIWPTTLVHKIDEESPFYGMSARDFLKKRWKIFAKSELSER